MDKAQAKMTEMYLITKITDNMVENVKGLKTAMAPETLTATAIAELDTGEQGLPSGSQKSENTESKKEKSQLGDDQKSRVILDKNQGKTYEQLLLKGQTQDKTKTDKNTLAILDEVDQKLTALETQNLNQIFTRTVPVDHKINDDNLLYDLNLDEESDEQEAFDDNEKPDDEDDWDEIDEDESEDNWTL